MKTFKVITNCAKQTITINVYENGKLYATYRDEFVSPDMMEAAEDWSESDIINYLRTSESYYRVK